MRLIMGLPSAGRSAGQDPYQKFESLQKEISGKDLSREVFDKKSGKIVTLKGNRFVRWLKTKFGNYEKIGTKLAKLIYEQIKNDFSEIKSDINNPTVSSEKLKGHTDNLKKRIDNIEAMKNSGDDKIKKYFNRTFPKNAYQNLADLHKQVTTLADQRFEFDRVEDNWNNSFTSLKDGFTEEKGKPIGLFFNSSYTLGNIDKFKHFATLDYYDTKKTALINVINEKLDSLNTKLDSSNELNPVSLNEIKTEIDNLKAFVKAVNENIRRPDSNLKIEISGLTSVDERCEKLTQQYNDFQTFQNDWETVMLSSDSNKYHNFVNDHVGINTAEKFGPFFNKDTDNLETKKAAYATKVYTQSVQKLDQAINIINFLTDPKREIDKEIENQFPKCKEYRSAFENGDVESMMSFATTQLEKYKSVRDFSNLLNEDHRKSLETKIEVLNRASAQMNTVFEQKIESKMVDIDREKESLNRKKESIQHEIDQIVTTKAELESHSRSSLEAYSKSMDTAKNLEKEVDKAAETPWALEGKPRERVEALIANVKNLSEINNVHGQQNEADDVVYLTNDYIRKLEDEFSLLAQDTVALENQIEGLNQRAGGGFKLGEKVSQWVDKNIEHLEGSGRLKEIIAEASKPKSLPASATELDDVSKIRVQINRLLEIEGKIDRLGSKEEAVKIFEELELTSMILDTDTLKDLQEMLRPQIEQRMIILQKDLQQALEQRENKKELASKSTKGQDLRTISDQINPLQIRKQAALSAIKAYAPVLEYLVVLKASNEEKLKIDESEKEKQNQEVLHNGLTAQLVELGEAEANLKVQKEKLEQLLNF